MEISSHRFGCRDPILEISKFKMIAVLHTATYLDSTDEKLAPIGIGASICYANNSRSSVNHCRFRNFTVNKQKTSASPITRLFTIGIEDKTGVLHAAASRPEAEVLIPITAAEMSLSRNYAKNCVDVESNFQSKTITCFVRHNISDYQDRDESRFTIVVLYANDDEDDNQQFTPTSHKVLSMLNESPDESSSTIKMSIEKTGSVKRSLKFQDATPANTSTEHELPDDSQNVQEADSLKKRHKNNF
ncbi:rotamase cyclophilin 2 [Striga asiatica]|uniref:Rotamase cyclophilin 2 n=1 Tax=Striga asiatica TaxID=4170 RepID=A0A5A7QSD4_STRAF|nr:rotamase cyclophilin 2 [Striga asiatica]